METAYRRKVVKLLVQGMAARFFATTTVSGRKGVVVHSTKQNIRHRIPAMEQSQNGEGFAVSLGRPHARKFCVRTRESCRIQQQQTVRMGIQRQRDVHRCSMKDIKFIEPKCHSIVGFEFIAFFTALFGVVATTENVCASSSRPIWISSFSSLKITRPHCLFHIFCSKL